MLTYDLIKKIKDLGFDCRIPALNGPYMEIYKIDEAYNPVVSIAKVYIDRLYVFSTNTDAFKALPEEVRKEIFDILVEYAYTPIEDREPPNKYVYKHRNLRTANGAIAYLGFRKKNKKVYPTVQGSYEDTDQCKVEITDKEIEEYAKEFSINLDNYIKTSYYEELKLWTRKSF